MINWPLVQILYFPVAHGHSHELAALIILALAIVWMSALSNHKLVHGFLGDLGNDIVSAHGFCHFTEASELVDGGLSDWDHGLNDVPHNALGARSSG